MQAVQAMAVADWVFLGVLLVSAVLGLWRGLVYEMVSVLGWVAAFVAAQWVATDLAPRLPLGDASEPVRFAAAFVLIFVACAFLGGLLAWLARKLVTAAGLRPVDRTLGLAFGLVRGFIILLALAVFVGMTPLRQETWWKESRGAALLATMLEGLKPVLPSVVRQSLNA